ncbi:MAG: hypothetical protein F6K56_24000 [Moorea sp. SIO3G5]|nr:hypothetical protein [Moorena sp. SIO3G5]
MANLILNAESAPTISRFSRFPTPDSRFPIPDSQLPQEFFTKLLKICYNIIFFVLQ